MAVTRKSAAAKTPRAPAKPKTTAKVTALAKPDEATPADANAPPAEDQAPDEQPPTTPEPDPSGVPEIEVKVSTFRTEPELEKPKRGQAPARASFYLVPQTGELHNRPGPGWVELTPEQTAVAEVLPRRKRAAWWRQQRRKDAARG